MPYNKGFRVFNLRWIVSSISTTGSTYENDDPTSGKILNSNNTFGYTDDKWGVKRCLEDFCAPLFTTEANGEGWQLDTDLCPDNEAVNLIPNVRVWALFFKHTTGARLMMGLNYFGMVSARANSPSVDPPVYTGNDNRYYDVGFLGKKTNILWPSTDPTTTGTNDSTPSGGGLFMSMIPPAVNGENQDTFSPDISIRDIAFYPQTMTPVQFQKLGIVYTTASTEHSVFTASVLPSGTSFIKQGTDDQSTDWANTYTESQQYGVVLGKTIKLSLFVCEEVVGFTGRYNNIRLGSQICGRILSECRQPDDTLSTAEYGELSSYGGMYRTSGSSSGSSPYLWNTSYSCIQIDRCCNTTCTDWPAILATYSSNGYSSSVSGFEYIYAGYVYGYNSAHLVSPNGQTKAKLRSDLFRFVNDSTNKIFGQTYNDNTWCFYGVTNYSSGAPSSSSTTILDTYGLFIKWDGAFNGTESLV